MHYFTANNVINSGCRANVWLDGRSIDKCIEANVDQGWVKVLIDNISDDMEIDTGEDFLYEVLYGKVDVELIDKNGNNAVFLGKSKDA